MRVYIAVFVLCLIAAIMTSEPHNSASFTKEDSQTQAQSNAISTQAADQNCKPCDNAQQTRANTPKWYTSPEWWLVILGLGTLPVLAWQAFASGNAAAAALKQVNYTAATERAWMMDTKVAPTAGATDRPEGGDQVFIQCVAKNEGRTPARVLGMNAFLATGPISDPGKTWDKKMYWFPKTLTPKWTIFPDKSSALHCPVQGLKGQPGQILRAPVADGETSFIHGVIKYWDVFSETERFTRFCYRFHPDDIAHGIPGGFLRAGGDGYNHQT